MDCLIHFLQFINFSDHHVQIQTFLKLEYREKKPCNEHLLGYLIDYFIKRLLLLTLSFFSLRKHGLIPKFMLQVVANMLTALFKNTIGNSGSSVIDKNI